jgi:hypothetical protein
MEESDIGSAQENSNVFEMPGFVRPDDSCSFCYFKD